MKKLATLLIAGSAIALSACGSTGNGNVETDAPYSQSRTASHGTVVDTNMGGGEKVFKDVQSK